MHALTHTHTQDARKTTEMAVIAKFELKLTGITETASYDWVTTTASSQPSQYIEEIIQFLESNFQILTIVHSLTVSVHARLVQRLVPSEVATSVD